MTQTMRIELQASLISLQYLLYQPTLKQWKKTRLFRVRCEIQQKSKVYFNIANKIAYQSIYSKIVLFFQNFKKENDQKYFPTYQLKHYLKVYNASFQAQLNPQYNTKGLTFQKNLSDLITIQQLTQFDNQNQKSVFEGFNALTIHRRCLCDVSEKNGNITDGVSNLTNLKAINQQKEGITNETVIRRKDLLDQQETINQKVGFSDMIKYRNMSSGSLSSRSSEISTSLINYFEDQQQDDLCKIDGLREWDLMLVFATDF